MQITEIPVGKFRVRGEKTEYVMLPGGSVFSSAPPWSFTWRKWAALESFAGLDCIPVVAGVDQVVTANAHSRKLQRK